MVYLIVLIIYYYLRMLILSIKDYTAEILRYIEPYHITAPLKWWAKIMRLYKNNYNTEKMDSNTNSTTTNSPITITNKHE
jgi:hypothetical protein